MTAVFFMSVPLCYWTVFTFISLYFEPETVIFFYISNHLTCDICHSFYVKSTELAGIFRTLNKHYYYYSKHVQDGWSISECS